MAFTNRWGASALMFTTALGVYSAASADVLYARLGGLAYYDATTNLTWLGNANAAVGSAYDTSSPGSGLMDWATANNWVASLNIGGVTGWRLPETNPINGTTFNYNFSYGGYTDYGYNISAPSTAYAGSMASEMAHMYYNTLRNTGYYSRQGSMTGCSISPPYCLTNTGPFTNIQPYDYWSYPAGTPGLDVAWDFSFHDGLQGWGERAPDTRYAWAMHSGDVGAVPVPAAAWLFGSGLLGLMGVRFKRRRPTFGD